MVRLGICRAGRWPALVAATIGWGMLAAPAGAHAFLQDATPKVGATLRQAPAEVEIGFTEGVEPAFSSIVVTDAAGARVDDGAVHAAGGAARLGVGLKTLGPGRYLVHWRVVSVDTHRTEGSYGFTVTP